MGHDLAGPALEVYFPPERAWVMERAIEGFSAIMTTLHGLLTDSVLMPIAKCFFEI